MATPTETFIGGLSNLRAHWPLDDGDPTNELVGGLDLTLTGSPTTGVDMGFAAGDTGITFTESTQWASRAHDAAFNAGTGDWSVAFWGVIPTSNTTTRYLVCHDGNGDAGSWDIKHTSSLFQTRFAGITPGNSSFTPNGSVKFLVFNWDRDGNHTRYIDGTLTYTADISSGSATDVSVTKILYLARRETAGQGTVSMAHVVLRAGLWTTTEMSGAMAARLEGVETDAPAGLTTITGAALTAAPKVNAPAGVATVTGAATNVGFSSSSAAAGVALMQAWATDWESSELLLAADAVPLEMLALPASTAVANQPVPSVSVNAGLATMRLRTYGKAIVPAGPTVQRIPGGSIYVGNPTGSIRI